MKKEEKEVLNRRKFLKVGGASLLGLAVSSSIYSFLIDRLWIDVTYVHLSLERLPEVFSGTRIVHFSDLHFGYFYELGNLLTLVQKINRLKPDLICFTGDLVEDDVGQLNDCIPVLQKLQANFGKTAILGNHDYRVGKSERVIKTLKESGFTFLKNESTFFEKTGNKLHVVGLDDLLIGTPNLEAALVGIPSEDFTVLLVHEPDFADTSVKYPIDLQLSGHSHGGQIRLPLIGPLYKPDGARKYISGLNKIDSKMFLYTSRGIGTTFFPVRFDCRPEITVVTLHS
jgi:uncharacterized protein